MSKSKDRYTALSGPEIEMVRRGWEECRSIAEIARGVGRHPKRVQEYYARFDTEYYRRPKVRKPARPNLYRTDFLPS
jgi:hypothetical protein